MSAFVWAAVAIAGVFGVLWVAVRLTVLATRYLERRPRRRWTRRPGAKNPRLWN